MPYCDTWREYKMNRDAMKLARFFSTFFRGFIVAFALSGFVALNTHYGESSGEILAAWFKAGIIFGIAYAYITYLEFNTGKVKKGIPSWAAGRLAQSLAPWLFLDSVMLFGIMIPSGGYIGGVIYNKYGLSLSILELTLVSVLSGAFRGLIYAHIGLPEMPWFVYRRIAEKIVRESSRS